MSTPMRAVFGLIAAALSVLTFHQGMWALLWLIGIMPIAPYPVRAIPPFGVPLILNLCFWGGLYGVLFGLLRPRFTQPLWLVGLGFGVLAVLVGFFVAAPIKGDPIGGGWAAMSWVRSLLINGCWGLGLGVIYPLLPGTRQTS
jgi:hypothetical protein